MSATVYLIAKSYPALFILPALQIPIVNGVIVRVGTNVVESIFMRLPQYIWNGASRLIRRRDRDIYHSGEEYVLVTFSKDLDFADYDNVDVL